MTRIAFYAPLKHPDHPVPSGERRMARLLLEALARAGFDPVVVSRFRSLDKRGDPALQRALEREAETEYARLLPRLRAEPPALWFTYHLYYKAPDLLGRRIADDLGIPYVAAEASHAPKRMTGPWERFARKTLAAIADADLVYAMSRRDGPMLVEARGDRGSIVPLAPFLDPGGAPSATNKQGPVRLIAVAMMREGDKRASYDLLAAALERMATGVDWRLDIVGDGPARSAVEAAFGKFGGRVVFHGQIDDPQAVRDHLEAADLFVWPGIGEAYGMAYLEAQASGTAVAALDLAGVATVVAPGRGGFLAAAPDAQGYADLLAGLIGDRERLADAGLAARSNVLANHSLGAAAETLGSTLWPLIRTRLHDEAPPADRGRMS